jgi:hypothetical protein
VCHWLPIAARWSASLRTSAICGWPSTAARDLVAAALATHGVVFFRDQDLTPEQHVAFAAPTWGLTGTTVGPAPNGAAARRVSAWARRDMGKVSAVGGIANPLRAETYFDPSLFLDVAAKA